MGICESYLIGIDISEDGDEAVLTVAEDKGSRVEIVNIITGTKARIIYEQLTNKNQI
jgi:hypothetical protein